MSEETTKLLKSQKLTFREISVLELRRGQYQPRHEFSEEGLKSLAETIKRVGVLEPLLVRELPSSSFEIIAGERRWRAAQMAGLKTVPCLLGHYDDEKASQIALIENINRENLNPIDEAYGVRRVLVEFNYTHQEIAAILGKTRIHITNLMRLLRLDQRVQKMLASGALSESHGKILAGVHIDKQHFYAEKCLSQQWSMRTLMKEIKIKEEQKNKKLKQKNDKDIDVSRLEQEVSDKFGHEIKFSLEKDKSGYVNIRFFTLDELDTILAKIQKKA